MCWNAAVSLNTFIVSAFAVVLALANGAVSWALALVVIGFASIQLCEFFAWRAIASGASTKAPALAAGALLVLHPLLALMLLVEAGKTRIVWALAAAYAAYVAFILTRIISTKSRKSWMKPAPNGHLMWGWRQNSSSSSASDWTVDIAYILLTGIPIVLAAPPVMTVIYFATLLLSMALFLREGTWGTMWCWTANIAALAFIWMVFAKHGAPAGCR